MSPRRKSNFNGKGPVTNQNGAVSSGGPNVCRTPVPGGPPVPIPYPSTAESKDLTGYDTSVKVSGGYVFTTAANLKRSRSDEPGRGNGIISNKRGAKVALITSSSDVKIGGDGVGRHSDLTFHNAENALGRLHLNDADADREDDQEEETLKDDAQKCCICGSQDHESPSAKPHGNHLRYFKKHRLASAQEEKEAKSQGKPRSEYNKSIRDRIRENYIKELASYDEQEHIWHGHPWSLLPESLQGHHLVDCQALISHPKWETLCWRLGYDINDKENGAMLPCRPQISCALHLPLHLGSHDAALTYDEQGNKVRLSDLPAGSASLARIAAKRKRGSSGKKSSKPKPSDTYLCYPEAVIDLIDIILEEATDGMYCDDPMLFTKSMNAASIKVLEKLANFSWTLEANGRRFIHGGKGCCASPKKDETVEENTKRRTINHGDIREHACKATFVHELHVGR